MKHRLFLAIEIPPDVSVHIVELQRRLERLNLPVRWEPVEKLHITTNFIGKVDDDVRNVIFRIAEQVSSVNFSFSLKPAFLETLYRKHEGSYVYLGLSGEVETLELLQKDLAHALSDLQVAQPEKYFPHITIGKLNKMDPVMTKEILQRIREVDFSPLPEFRVTSLVLYESLLSRDGSHYRRIGHFMLK